MSWRDSAEVGRGSEQFPAGAKFDVELIGLALVDFYEMAPTVV